MLLVLLALARPVAGDESVTTSFLPSRDMPGLRNPQGRYAALSGSCNGVDELANVWFRSRRDWPGLQSLHDATAQIASQQGTPYLEQVLATAQLMSYREGIPAVEMEFATRRPDDFAGEVVARLRAEQAPVSLGLGGPTGLHRVSVYGARQVGGHWIFQVADSNHATDRPDQITMEFDPGSRRWQERVAGQPAESWTRGDLIRSPVTRPVEYNQLMQMALQGKPVREIQTALDVSLVPAPVVRPAVLLHHPKVGGVLLQFDPLALAGLPEAEQARLDSAIRSFLVEETPGTTVLRTGPASQELVLVPLRGLRPEGDLGGLTGLRGFVQRPDGTLWLVGQREPGAPPIPAALLVVALQTVYRSDALPFVSLDPEPGQLSGPQRVRLGGLPPALRRSQFVRDLLEADYLMKRINLGQVAAGVPGFESWHDLMERSEQPGQVRMWLTPAQPPPGTCFQLSGPQGRAVLLEAPVQVLSEQEKLEGAGMPHAEVDRVSEEAAAELTRRFPELARKHLEFRRLGQLFEVAELAAAWRALKVTGPELSPWLTAVPAPVAVPASYPGIGPLKMGDGRFVLSGGAVVRTDFRPEALVPAPFLAPLLQSSGGAVRLELPGEMALTGPETELLVEDARLDQAWQALVRGDAEGALERLPATSSSPRSRRLRAAALAGVGRFSEAAAQLSGEPGSPAEQAQRALLRASAGQAEAARADATEALQRAPEDEEVLALATLARINAFDLEAAADSLTRLYRLVPAHPMIPWLDGQIVFMRALGPERARAMLALSARLPAPVARALAEARQGRTEGLIPALRGVEAGTYPAPPELYLAERLRAQLVLSVLRADPPDPELLRAADQGVERLLADHPDWPSASFCKALLVVARQGETADFAAAVRAVASHSAAHDPLLPGLREMMGVNDLAPLLPVLALLDQPDSQNRQALLELAGELCPAGAGRDFLVRLAHPPASLATGLGAPDDPATRWQLLDRLTEGVETIPPEDPAYVLAVGTCLLPMQTLATSEQLYFQARSGAEASYQRLTDRALALARPDRAPRALAFSPQLRAAVWLEAAMGVAAPCWRPDYPGFAPMKAAVPRLQRLDSPGLSPGQVRSLLSLAADSVESFMKILAADVDRPIAAMRARHGAVTADRVAFLVWVFNASQSRGALSGLERVVRIYPGIEKTPEYQRCKRDSDRMARGEFGPPLETLWQRVLGGIHSRLDAESVLACLQALRPLCKGLQAFLDRCAVQARLRIQMGVPESTR